MSNIFVIDIGTSSMRGILYDSNGHILNIVQILYSPEYLSNNLVEQDPHSFESSLIQIIKQTLLWTQTHGISIDAISVTSQRSSAIPVDKSGNPLYKAIMWQDKRTYSICKEFEGHTEEIYNITGSKINPVFTAPKITWLKRNEPDIYNNTYKILVIPDYVMFLMTGCFITDYTYGSRTSLMNIETLEWDDYALKLFEVDRSKLCDLIPQGSIIGFTNEEFKRKTGLKTGIPVISSGGDQQCAALGAGVIENGSLQVTTGTGSFVIASSDKPQLDSRSKIICNVSAVQGKYVLEASILTTSTIYNWFFENFYKDCIGKTSLSETIDKDAASSPVGSNGVITLPHFQGRGSPDWNTLAKGMFFNVTLGTTRGDFARSILEGIAAEISENIEFMSQSIGEIQKISVSGGLTKCSLFNQIQTDFYNKTIYLPANKETTSLGAWVSAAVTLGMYPSYQTALDHSNTGLQQLHYSPDSSNTEIYRKHKNYRKTLYDTLNSSGIYNMINN